MTRDQMLLLRGLLLTGDDGARQMMDWCSTTDLDSVDRPSHRLLPLLFRNLSTYNLAPPELTRLRGVYRKTWYRNQQHVAAVTKATGLLDSAGISHALVDGLPVALTAYGDSGTRMLGVVRLVVPVADVEGTIDVLSQGGFVVQRPARLHGWGIPTVLGTSGGGLLDVRGSVYGPGWHNAPDQELWARRTEFGFDGFRTSTLDATDTIVLAAASAASTRESFLQGLTDVAFLARGADSIDWFQLSERYRGTLLPLPLHEALGVLIDELDVPVCSGAAEWYSGYRSQLIDRVGLWTHRNGRRLLRLPRWYRRGRRDEHDPRNQSGFLSFAAAVYGIKSPADVMQRLQTRRDAARG